MAKLFHFKSDSTQPLQVLKIIHNQQSGTQIIRFAGSTWLR